MVESIPREQPIIFAPDRNLGGYIKGITGRENMVLWDGACEVHEQFSLAGLQALKKAHPAAKVVVHPECKAEVVEMADYAGSTAGILKYCKDSEAEEFIVTTESGILYEMERTLPEKKFYPVPHRGCEGCISCLDMKKVTLENIYETLLNETPEVVIDEEVRAKAEGAIVRMLAL